MDLTLYTKINSKCIISLYAKCKATKLLEENRETLCDVRFGDELLNTTAIA